MIALAAPVALALLAPFAPAQDAPAPEPTVATPAVSARVPAALAVLVPDDATVLAMTSSINDLEAEVQALVESIMPGMGGIASADMLFLQMFPPGLDSSAIDRTKPLAMALGPVTMEAEPQVYVMVPTEQPDAVKEAFVEEEGMVYKASAGYLAISMGESYGTCSTASPLLARLPDGALAVSADTGAILTEMEPMVSMLLSQVRMELSDIKAMFPPEEAAQMTVGLDLYYDMLQGVVTSLDGLDVALDLGAREVGLHTVMHYAPDSAMGGFALEGPTSAARFLPLLQDGQVGMLLGADQGELWELFEPSIQRMLSIYPEEFAASLEASMQSYEVMYAAMGDGLVADFGFGDAGLEGTAYLAVTDFQALLDAYRTALRGPALRDLGLAFESEESATLGDYQLHRFTFDIDAESMMGQLTEGQVPPEDVQEVARMIEAFYGERMQFTLANQGDLAVVQLGGTDEQLVASLERGASPRGMLPSVARIADLAVDANPFVYYRMDLPRMMGAVVPRMAEITGEEPPAGLETMGDLSAPMGMYMGVEPTRMSMGMTVDAAGMAQLVQWFMMMEEL